VVVRVALFGLRQNNKLANNVFLMTAKNRYSGESQAEKLKLSTTLYALGCLHAANLIGILPKCWLGEFSQLILANSKKLLLSPCDIAKPQAAKW